MMMRTLVALVTVFSVQVAVSQKEGTAERYAKLITVAELKTDLYILASDSLEGRDTGRRGQKLAADYIQHKFKEYGIPPVKAEDPNAIVEGYFQPFEVVQERGGSLSLESAGKKLQFLHELFYVNEVLKEDVAVNEIILMADGSKLVSTKGLKGKVVVVVDRSEGNSMAFWGKLRMWNTAAAAAEVRLLLVATERVPTLVEEIGHYVSGGRMRLAIDPAPVQREGALQTIVVDTKALGAMLGKKGKAALVKNKAGAKVAVDFMVKYTNLSEELMTENVLAYIEGTDKKDELVVITAHYDHIGIEGDEVFNGADDDGSGTVAIMAIAKAFAKAKAEGNGPRRSVLVMPVSGEEKGLLGSKFYSERPVFPLENTVANLNIDMIGRVDSAHTGKAPYIYVIGSDRLSTDLHNINEEANSTHTQLELDYTFNAEDDPNKFYYRSDHYNFARKGVPAIFYFSGVHEDYHKSTDTVEKIDFELLHQRALLTFHTAWQLANREERIVVDGKVE